MQLHLVCLKFWACLHRALPLDDVDPVRLGGVVNLVAVLVALVEEKFGQRHIGLLVVLVEDDARQLLV